MYIARIQIFILYNYYTVSYSINAHHSNLFVLSKKLQSMVYSCIYYVTVLWSAYRFTSRFILVCIYEINQVNIILYHFISIYIIVIYKFPMIFVFLFSFCKNTLLFPCSWEKMKEVEFIKEITVSFSSE